MSEVSEGAIRRQLDEIQTLLIVERAKQDAMWGGVCQDMRHTPQDWHGILSQELGCLATITLNSREGYEAALVKIQAVAERAILCHRLGVVQCSPRRSK